MVDIARRLNISPATVSRALSSSREISQETRRRVTDMAKELHYTPNLIARNLRLAETLTIGCLVFEYSNPFFVPMIRGIEEVVEGKGYSVMISESHYRLADEQRLVSNYLMHQIRGLIIMPVLEQIDHLKDVRDGGLPVISVGRVVPGLDCISIDNSSGASMIAEHFASIGHSKVGVVHSGSPFNEAEVTRTRAFAAAARSLGLKCDRSWTVQVGANTVAGGARGAERWIALSDRPTAVFCSNDRVAMGFCHRLRGAGYSVPRDCAVAGFDDIPDSEYLEVPLTTIAYPKHLMGVMAAEWVLDAPNRGRAAVVPRHRLLEPSLVVRQSTVNGGVS